MKYALLTLFFILPFSIFAQDTIVKDTVTITDETHIKKDTLTAQALSREDSIVQFAKTFIGVPYKYGSINPKVGFDCSGFVNYVFTHFNVTVPRSSKYFVGIGESVKLKGCKPGDIIIFAGYDRVKRPIGHVGIIYSNVNDTVMFLHSASSKKRGVVLSNYTTTSYYNTRLVGIVRKLY